MKEKPTKFDTKR